MKKIELTPRLQAVASFVPDGARLADIGTDHAYLPVSLLLEGRIPSAVAADLRKGPLDRARQTAREHGCTEKVKFRLCDGLSDVKSYETDVIAIAGMGGETIAEILSAAKWVKEKNLPVILQPMSSQPELRRWLVDHGYVIQREVVAREGEKFYVILTVRGGESPTYTSAELWAGRQRQGEENPHRGEYLADQIFRRQRALAGMRRSSSLTEEELAREEALLAGLKGMQEEWNTWQR